MPPLDKHARRQRIEKLLTMVEDLNALEALPLPERFHRLVAWAESTSPPLNRSGCISNGNAPWSVLWKNPPAKPRPSRCFPPPALP